MLCVPAESPGVAQVAVREFPLPVTTAAEHPEMDVLPSLKLTVPVGDTPVTVAVNVTLDPIGEGFAELATLVVVATLDVTTCDSALPVFAILPASPP